MQSTLHQLATQLDQLRKQWPEFSDTELNLPAAPGRWSKREILGHMIDSAANNHARFVLAQSGPEPYVVVPYDQDRWVSSGNYFAAPAADLLTLWLAYNEQLSRMVQRIPAAVLARECLTPGGTIVTLEWLIRDYVLHLEHHVQQILHE